LRQGPYFQTGASRFPSEFVSRWLLFFPFFGQDLLPAQWVIWDYCSTSRAFPPQKLFPGWSPSPPPMHKGTFCVCPPAGSVDIKPPETESGGTARSAPRLSLSSGVAKSRSPLWFFPRFQRFRDVQPLWTRGPCGFLFNFGVIYSAKTTSFFPLVLFESPPSS